MHRFVFASPLLFVACTSPLGKNDSSAQGCDTAGTELAAACACDTAAVEIGSGDVTYEPLSDGAALTMVHGPQGGWHMLGSARFHNLLPIVTIHYTIEVAASGSIISDNTYRVQMVEDEECAGFYPGMYGYLDVSALAEGDRDTPPELLGGTELLLRMEVTDTESRAASDTLSVIAALDAVDAEVDTGTDTDGG